MEEISLAPFHCRCKLSRGPEAEIIDFVIEKVPQLDPAKNEFGTIRVDTLREIGVNKIFLLVSRSELKDVIDLYFLEKAGFSIADHLGEALQKEAGFDPAMVSFLLSELRVEAIPEYVVSPISVQELRSFIDKLRKDLAGLSFPGKSA